MALTIIVVSDNLAMRLILKEIMRTMRKKRVWKTRMLTRVIPSIYQAWASKTTKMMKAMMMKAMISR